MTQARAGSPPRMRGKLPPTKFEGDVYGITPADAGKTFNGYGNIESAEDHPRGCGENKKTNEKRSDRQGSPPRMRGKPDEDISAQGVNRITPADAGKTPKSD